MSGGEKARVALAKTIVSKANFLLLDEPTNHLDIHSVDLLVEALNKYEGSYILVSHDRYFLDRTVEHIFRFEGNGMLRQYPGNYSAFLEARQKEEGESAAVKHETNVRVAKQERAHSPTVKRKLSFKERNELEMLETRIQEAERRQSEIETELAANSSDAHLVHQLFKERETLLVQLARVVGANEQADGISSRNRISPP